MYIPNIVDTPWMGSTDTWLDMFRMSDELRRMLFSSDARPMIVTEAKSYEWWMSDAKPYELRGDVGVVTVKGGLVKGMVSNVVASYMNTTGYDNIALALAEAVNDEKAKGIVLQVDSGGGQAMGALEAATNVRAAGKRKTVVAHVAYSCSAAYWMTSMADTIVMASDGSAGSIGTAAIIPVRKRMMQEAGIDITVFRSHEHKMRATGVEDLEDNDTQAIESMLAHHNDAFIRVVSAARGLPETKLRGELGGKVFHGQDAKTKGFVDVLGSVSKAMDIARGAKR